MRFLPLLISSLTATGYALQDVCRLRTTKTVLSTTTIHGTVPTNIADVVSSILDTVPEMIPTLSTVASYHAVSTAIADSVSPIRSTGLAKSRIVSASIGPGKASTNIAKPTPSIHLTRSVITSALSTVASHAAISPHIAITPPSESSYWLEQMPAKGFAAFNPAPSEYKLFRNVKDYGAKGDGSTDDTEAINNAIQDGQRCGPSVCQSSTTTPAIVYFPAGVSIVSKSIVPYYMTQLIGNPNSMPVLKATSNFEGLGVIDGDPYKPGGDGEQG